jgi:hypothetical protein
MAVHETRTLVRLEALRFADISLLFYIFVINYLKSEIKLKYLNTQSVPRRKHTPRL